MKPQFINRLIGSSAALGVASVLVVSSARAQTNSFPTLVSGNSIAQIDPTSQAGMFSWLVDGNRVLEKQWFWYRIYQTPEASIDTIGLPFITVNSPSSVTLRYSHSLFDLVLSYTLTGAVGSADIDEQIQVINKSGTFLDFSLYEYSDFNLSAADSVVISKNLSGKFFKATQTGGGTFQETIVAPGANHAEANNPVALLAKLNDGVATTLSDVVNAGPGDVAYAEQWDWLQIANGDSRQIGKDKLIIVPEPATGALALAGWALLAVIRRKK